ncbi:MAG: HD domain-containing protein [Ruminococcaceae bacterium]|nr:HD domain-containing protein [Oscillospiraceae bacterium]
MVSFKEVKENEAIAEYIRKADSSLIALGYTEHSFAHVGKVVSVTEYIMQTLGFDEKDIELAKIAAYMHDIGNLVNRVDHSQSGAIMAFRILDNMGMEAADIATVVTAIGNHDEGTGVPVNEMSAALILADKSDVRRSRVRNRDESTFDIHDRVNYSVTHSNLAISEDRGEILLELEIDSNYSSVMDYFEIFMKRMILCRKAAERLGMRFRLKINGQILL